MVEERDYIYKKIIHPDLYESVVIFLYLFSFLIFSLGLLGFFRGLYILLAFILSLLVVIFLKPRIKFERIYFVFIFLVPFILLGFVFFRGFLAGDGMGTWLPWARDMASNNGMPLFVTTSSELFSSSGQPLFSLFLSIIFLMIKQPNLSLLVVPLIFNILTLIFLYQWGKLLKIDKGFLIFIPLLFLTNYQLAKYAPNVTQESLILFFFTAFFYFFDIYQQKKDSKYILFLVMIAILAVLSKISGYFLIIPLIYLFFKGKWFKNNNFYFSLFLTWPATFWLMRSWIVFGNPFHPRFNNLFNGLYGFVLQHISFFMPLRTDVFLQPNIYFLAILGAFPLLIASFYGLVKQKKMIVLITILILFFLEAKISLGSAGNPRHLYPILGITIIYGLWAITQINSKLFLGVLLVLGFLPALAIKPFYSTSQFLAPVENNLAHLAVINDWLHTNALLVVILLGVAFYLFYNKQILSGKFLIVTVFCLSLLRSSILQVSWLNVWLPILSFILLFIFIIFIKRTVLAKNLLLVFVIGFLAVNSVGLSAANFIGHKQFAFPKPELFARDMIIAEQIQKVEGQNKDFYIATDVGNNLNWIFGYKKTKTIINEAFAGLTNGGYRPSMSPEELQIFLKLNNFKYLIQNRESLGDFFTKVFSSSKYYELIYDREPMGVDNENIRIWRLKE